MTDRYDEYRRRANEAQAHADRAISDVDRASWLKVAEGWLGMIPGRHESAQEKFDNAAHAQGTGQSDSDTSN